MIGAWLTVQLALAGAPAETNFSATSVGAQFTQAPALANLDRSQDTDILLSQRLRWTLSEGDRLAVRLRADGRFTISPDGTLDPADGGSAFFERNRVRQLGASFVSRKMTLDVGRHPVHKGGPRLVDGLQLVLHPSTVFDIGFWGGMSPDLFTTELRQRFGGGPIIAYSASRIQASLVGEILFGGGGLDRAAMLAQARLSAARTVEVSGRLDMNLVAPAPDDPNETAPHLADGQLFARWAPVEAARIDVFWDAFSSYRYRNTENLDPDIQRFALRMRPNDLRLDAVLQDCLEPKVAHALGANFSLNPRNDGVSPNVQLKGRYRFGGKEDLQLNDPVNNVQPKCGFDDVNTFLRVNPTVGLTGLPIGGSLDVSADGNYYIIDGKSQIDAGVIVFWEPADTGVFAFDTSYRVLVNPYDEAKNPTGYQGLGHYFDAFVDLVVPPADMMIGTGLNVVTEPGPIVDDLGVGAYARVTKYLRKRKKD